MKPNEYATIAGQLAEELRQHLSANGGYANLNLAGSALLHNWVQVGTAQRSALSTLAGEPIIVKVSVVLERPRNNETNV